MVCLGMNGTVRIKTFVSKLFYCRCNCKYIFKQGFRCISKTSKQLPLYRTYTGMNGNARSVSSKAGKIVICEERESWEMLVSTEKLTVLEKKIHECHRNAVKKRELMYTDPQTGYQVMTRLAHLERGDCCGNSCRHCPYGQVNVPVDKKKKFNTALYI